MECLASPEGWWFHLRRCAECGHIGCCGSSPRQHASKHAAATGHPIIAGFEPGEDLFYDYEKRAMIEGVVLLPPLIRIPKTSPHLDRREVPANWESLLSQGELAIPGWQIVRFGSTAGASRRIPIHRSPGALHEFT
jgi:hypothetical protein